MAWGLDGRFWGGTGGLNLRLNREDFGNIGSTLL